MKTYRPQFEQLENRNMLAGNALNQLAGQYPIDAHEMTAQYVALEQSGVRNEVADVMTKVPASKEGRSVDTAPQHPHISVHVEEGDHGPELLVHFDAMPPAHAVLTKELHVIGQVVAVAGEGELHMSLPHEYGTYTLFFQGEDHEVIATVDIVVDESGVHTGEVETPHEEHEEHPHLPHDEHHEEHATHEEHKEHPAHEEHGVHHHEHVYHEPHAHEHNHVHHLHEHEHDEEHDEDEHGKKKHKEGDKEEHPAEEKKATEDKKPEAAAKEQPAMKSNPEKSDVKTQGEEAAKEVPPVSIAPEFVDTVFADYPEQKSEKVEAAIIQSNDALIAAGLTSAAALAYMRRRRRKSVEQIIAS